MNYQSLKDIIHIEPLAAKVLIAGIECYLVGGYVRDAMRGIRSKDLDFVVRGNARRLVEKVFQETGGSIVEFKKAGMTRLVARDSTLDFSELIGNIEDDLRKRDFTVNAIAWSVKDGLIDPLNGADDIKKKTIRAVSEENFIDDPLRLLRAYRFAGEFDWKINVKTRGNIRKLKDLIRLSASERITLEFFKLMDSDNCLNALKLAFEDGLLHEILSFDASLLSNNLKALTRLDSFVKNLHEEYGIAFNKPFSQGLSYLGLIRMEQILYGSDLKKGKLMLSSAILRRIKVTTGLLRDYSENKNAYKSRIFDMFSEAGEAVIDIAILLRSRRLVREGERFRNIKPVMPAEDIIRITQARGPKIGELINEMRKAQFLGKIRNENDAGAWLTKSQK